MPTNPLEGLKALGEQLRTQIGEELALDVLRRQEPAGKTASLLNPTSIAATYLHVIHQPHSAWSAEVELRPWVESF